MNLDPRQTRATARRRSSPWRSVAWWTVIAVLLCGYGALAGLLAALAVTAT